jgi:hypothetical protein
MAKKKKTTRKKAAPAPVQKERTPFWDYSGAVLLIVLGLFTLLGGFNTGGKLPIGLFGAADWAFGWAAYIVPIALIYWGVYKFIAEDRRIPLGKLFSVLAVLLFASSWFYTAFVEQTSVQCSSVHSMKCQHLSYYSYSR